MNQVSYSKPVACSLKSKTHVGVTLTQGMKVMLVFYSYIFQV